jgi:hypothetical protein
MKNSSTPKPQNVRWHSAIPDALSNRLNLAGNLFYPLPTTLADLLDQHLAKAIGGTAVSDEREIADLADQRDAAALRDGVAVQYPFLIDRSPPLTVEILQAAGSKVPEKVMEELGATLSHAFRYAQAYCGWLLNQNEYWSDLEQLVSHEDEASSKLPAPKFRILGGTQLPLADAVQSIDVQRYKCFYEKWRLQTLTTHDLPLCVSPQLTGTTVYNPNAPAGTINPVIPDIFPIDGKGMVNKSLEAATRSTIAPHLQSWKELICSTSRTKKKLDTYRRQFVLQHYWRVLTQRYPEALGRKVMKLDELFSNYFNLSTDIIRSDRSALAMLLERHVSNR